MIESRFSAQMNEIEKSVSITMTLSLEEVKQRKETLQRKIKNCQVNIQNFTDQLILLQQELNTLTQLDVSL